MWPSWPFRWLVSSPNVSSTVPPPALLQFNPRSVAAKLADRRQAALLQAALRQATPALLLPPCSALPLRDAPEVAPPAVSLAEVAVSVPSVTTGLQKALVPSVTTGLQKALAVAKSDRSP